MTKSIQPGSIEAERYFQDWHRKSAKTYGKAPSISKHEANEMLRIAGLKGLPAFGYRKTVYAGRNADGYPIEVWLENVAGEYRVEHYTSVSRLTIDEIFAEERAAA